MVLFNYSTREVTTKVVYYGPGLCGKTTNLKFIYDSLPTGSKSKMLSLATNQDRTLFFDFLPLDLGTIKGMKVRLQLYTVPGQVYYNTTRQLVLKGSDGVIFVADSQDFAMDANLESWNNLKENLVGMGLHLPDFPHVVQYNKRDLPSVVPAEEMNALINEFNAPWFEGIATTGYNVENPLKALTKLVLKKLAAQYGLLPGEDISEKDIVLIQKESEPRKLRRSTGGVMGFDNENLDLLWEKEEQKKDSFAFEGEEFEFQEVTPPMPAAPPSAIARPGAQGPVPPKAPATAPAPFEELTPSKPLPDRPSSPIQLESPVPVKAPAPAVPTPQGPFEEVFAPPPDLEPAQESGPASMPAEAYPAGGLELEPVPMPGMTAAPKVEPDMEPAPLSVEKLERQMHAARVGQPQEKPAGPPPAPVAPAAGPSALREIVIPVTLSRKDLESAQRGELVLKLKIKIGD